MPKHLAVVQDEGSALTNRGIVNFVGASVTVADDAANARTNVTISGGTGHTIQDEGSALSARTGLNFVGAGVTATDDSANNRTTVTIAGGGSQVIYTDVGDPDPNPASYPTGTLWIEVLS